MRGDFRGEAMRGNDNWVSCLISERRYGEPVFRTVIWILVGVGVAGGLSSCSRLKRMAAGKQEPTRVAPPVPAQFRGAGYRDPVARVTLEDVTPQEVTEKNVGRLIEREKELMWTDPDNPETGLEGMEEIMALSAKRGPWLISFGEARRAAMREGKPILIWFTDTRSSPLCAYLSAEVFSKKEFSKWAEQEVVRLRLDFNVKGESRGQGHSAMDDKLRKEDYLEVLKKRYKVLGLPMVLLMAPDGTVTSRYRGYQKTYHDFYLSRLQNDVKIAKSHHEKWRSKMGRRGYREWNDNKGRTVFAKLSRYSGGEMILVEPDGKRLKALEKNLSSSDRAWIAEEKAKRGHP